MKISIALATYNGEKYILEQLESFASQNRLPDELIICDDKSKDATISIVKEFKKTAPFDVQIFVNDQNLGYAQNFGNALSFCTGDLVFLSDQDDIWFPNKIEEVVQLATKNPEVFVFINDAELTDEMLVPTGITKIQQFNTTKTSINSFVQGCCCAIRKDFLTIALPIPDSYNSHDGWIMELARFHSAKMVFEKTLQYYRIHTNNTSSFSLNKPKKASLISKTVTKAFTPKNEMRKELSMALELQMKINKRLKKSEGFNCFPQGQTKIAQDEANQKQRALYTRKKIISLPLILRQTTVLYYHLNGFYKKHFNGYKSFIRDLFIL